MRFLARLCVFLALLWGTAAQALITRVSGQHTSSSVTATSKSNTLTNNPTAGNLVVVVIGCESAPSLTFTVTDANSNTYTATTHSPGTDGSFSTIGIYFLANAPANASKTINITWGGTSQTVESWVQEYAGAATASVLEQEQAHLAFDEGGTLTTINLPSYTPTNANDLIVTVSSISSGCASVPAPYAVVDAIANAQCATDNIQTTATATGTYATAPSAANWIGMVAAFKAAAGAACPPPSLALLGVGC